LHRVAEHGPDGPWAWSRGDADCSGSIGGGPTDDAAAEELLARQAANAVEDAAMQRKLVGFAWKCMDKAVQSLGQQRFEDPLAKCQAFVASWVPELLCRFAQSSGSLQEHLPLQAAAIFFCGVLGCGLPRELQPIPPPEEWQEYVVERVRTQYSILCPTPISRDPAPRPPAAELSSEVAGEGKRLRGGLGEEEEGVARHKRLRRKSAATCLAALPPPPSPARAAELGPCVALGATVRLGGFNAYACFNGQWAKVVRNCGDGRYDLDLLGEYAGARLRWVAGAKMEPVQAAGELAAREGEAT